MDILSAAVLQIPCPSCGRTYEVPAAQVMQSQEILDEGLVCRSDDECPPLYLASLLDHEDLALLRQTWLRLHQQAAGRGGELFLRRDAT